MSAETSSGMRGIRVLRALMVVAGAGLVAAGSLADVLGFGGVPGLGRSQMMLVIAGLVLAGAGVLTGAPTLGRLVSSAQRGTAAWRTVGLAHILMLAIAFAVLAGMAEAIVMALRRFAFGEMPRASQQLVWMASLANVLLLMAVGVLLWIAAFAWRGLRSIYVVTFIFGYLVADTLILSTRIGERIAPWANLLLVVGCATLAARLVADRWQSWERRLGRAVAALVLLVAALGIATTAHRGVRERILWAGLPAADATAPNIIFIILDTVRSMSLSLHGYERPTTPKLERLAASSAVFDHAIAPAPWTLPSHATVFTGIDPDRLSANWRTPLDDAHPTIAEHLSARGYATAAFSANLAYVTTETGLARGFARFEDFAASPGEVVRNSRMLRRLALWARLDALLSERMPGRKTAEDLNRSFLGWLDRRAEGRPFFAFLNYFDAHDPYYAPAPFDTLYGSGDHTLWSYVWGQQPSPDVVESWVLGYDRALTYLDHTLGELFEELRRRGLLDNTILVVSSDHGEHLGEHGFMRHGSTLYRPVLAVPLLVRYPPLVPAATRVAEPVTLRDVPATIIELAGLAERTPMPGSSLSRFWLDSSGSPGPPAEAGPIYAETRQAIRVPPRYPNAAADLKALIVDGYHYIHSSDGSEELYRYLEDPGEEHDLMSAGEPPTVIRGLRRLLARRAAAADADMASRQRTPYDHD
jgi:arylsulfatase A-like enzyme